VALHDFPALQVATVRECALWLENDADLADVRGKIVRILPLFPASLRVIWSCTPKPQDRAIVDQLWRTFGPKGKVEHLP
jgi:hypothetical protein